MIPVWILGVVLVVLGAAGFSTDWQRRAVVRDRDSLKQQLARYRHGELKHGSAESEAYSLYAGMWGKQGFEPNWGRIAESPEWREQIRPWLEKMWGGCAFKVARTSDPVELARLSERLMALEWLIRQPEGEVAAKLARERAITDAKNDLGLDEEDEE